MAIPLPLVGLGVQGALGVASGTIGYKRRRQEQRDAQAMFDQNMAQYRNQDLSNPYRNMQNPYEDMTVNQQAADFQAQQQQQGMAATMDALKGAAGSSGIGALSQSLLAQQSQNAQRASADIARQEQSIASQQAQAAGQLQALERKGDLLSRKLKREQYSTELGMSQQRLASANLARQQATQALLGGVGDLTGAGIGFYNESIYGG